jgi:hypothetical protein
VAVRTLLVPVSVAALGLAALAGTARAEPPGPEVTPAPAPVVTPAVPAGGSPPPTRSGDGAGVAVGEGAVDPPRRSTVDPIRPPPLHVEYAQYGVAIQALVNLDAGAMCGRGVSPSSASAPAPCILGSGGGLVMRGGYRSPGPWYFGGAYAFAKTDSSNLFRLGIFQQLWAELRYLPDTGQRIAPFATAGLGGAVYGNEWGVETGGAMLLIGGGLQFEVSRIAVVGIGLSYKPCLIAGWTDTAGYSRPLGVANFFGLDLQLEIRSEVGRR